MFRPAGLLGKLAFEMSLREEQSAADRVARRRVWCYVIVAAGITLGCIGLQFTTWHSTAELHTVMETVATTLALVVAATAPFRYYSERDNKFLFIGTGFFVTALLDGHHTVITGVAFRDYFPSSRESLTSWSWTSSRTFLAVLMIVSWWASQRPRRLRIRAVHVYGVMTLLTVATFLLFAFVPLVKPQPLGTLFGPPEELLIALLFFVALAGFLRADNWRRDAFSHWLVLALIVSVLCQAVAMARSFQAHDVMFDVAHLLKIASYGCVLVGILVSTYQLYADVEDGVRRSLESEERFQLAVRGTADGIWDWDLTSNTVWYSGRMRELLGYRGDDEDAFPSLLEAFNRHLHPEDHKRTWAAVDLHIKDDQPYDVEYRLRTKSGQWRWFRARGACVRDHQGTAVRMAGSIRDIQELYDQGQTLCQMERRLEHALEGARVGLWDWNVETGDVYYSPQMKIQLGYDPEDPWSDYTEWENRLHEDDRDEAIARVKNYLAQNSDEYISTFRMRHKDGSYRWILSQGKAEWNPDGEPRRIIGVHVDVTEQRQLAEKLADTNTQLARINRDLARSNAELEHFAYVASHDLRSPLRNINSLTQWILEDAGPMLPEASRDDLLLLRQRVDLMNRLLNDLLQYSRVGRVESDPEDIDPGEVVAEVIDLLGIPASFRVDVQPDMPHLRSPRTAIRKVFQNLLDNAIKHHHRSAGLIEIRAADRGRLVEFAVRDDGPGIDPMFHEKVFQIFQTLQRRDDLDTSGMGLAIVKKTVEMYGGQLTLASKVGHGTTFSFTWPKDAIVPVSH